MSLFDGILLRLHIWRGRKHAEKAGREIEQVTFKKAALSGTGISGAVSATLAMIALWVSVITQGAPITQDLIMQTLGVISLWLTLVFARRGIMKSGSVQ